MNADHVTAGVSATSVTAMLAAVLQHFQPGLDTATAGAEAGLIVLALGGLAGLLQNYLMKKPAA